MKILGLGNALVDVLSKLESDETLVKIGIQKGAMDMISREQMYVIRKYQANTETTQAPGGANCNTMRAIALLGGQSGFIGKVGDDNLAEFYTNQKLPGVGISIGLTRLFYQLSEINAIKADRESVSQLLIIPMDEQMEDGLAIANTLRSAGINTDVYLEEGKIKKKMKYADKWRIPYVLIVGEEEIKNQKFSLKDMNAGEQKELSIEEIINELKN